MTSILRGDPEAAPQRARPARFDSLLEKIIEHPLFALAAISYAVSLAVLTWAQVRGIEDAGAGLALGWLFALALWRVGR